MGEDRIKPIPRGLFEHFLQETGCTLKRTKGDHLVYVRTGLPRPIILQAKKEVQPFIIRSNLKTLGISSDEYLQILKRLK